MAERLPSIDEIMKFDVKAARQFSKQYDVDITGCRQLQEIQDRLIDYCRRNSTSNPTQESNQGGLLNAQIDTDKIANKLLEKFKNIQKLHGEFPAKLQGNLEKSYPDIQKQFKDREQNLKKRETWILVAGEVGSGKSSAINLILDTQLLPIDALRCTNTVVEIRSSDKKEALCFYRPQLSDSNERVRRISPKIIDMSGLSGIQQFKDCVCECESDESDDNPYDRIELYYPFKTLSRGVVIVDTPGIEGGNNVDQSLQKYLSKAFGFIYVINTNAAGGVQQGRLGHLLKTVVNSSEEMNPEASLFIANKWENVPERDKPDVQKETFEKLSRVYPGIRPSQVHYMSVTKSRELCMRHQQQTQEHKDLLEKIGRLVPNSMRQGFTNHYCWLSSYLTRAAYLLRVTGLQQDMSREELEAKFEQMQRHMANLQRDSDVTVKKLQEKIEFEIYRITNMIKLEMKNRDFRNSVCNWEDRAECPPVSKRWKTIADAAAVGISQRIASTLDGWQRQHAVLRVIDNEIVNVFTNEFGLLEHQVEDIENFLATSRGRTSLLQTVRVVPVRRIFARKKGKVERTYTTLGGAVSCIGMLDTSKRDVKALFRDYNDKNKARIMSEATVLYMKSIFEHDMGSKLRKFFARFFKDIEEAAKRLPVFLKADEQLIETLRHSMSEIENVREKLPELLGMCIEYHGGLDIFYINNIFKFDYDKHELGWETKKKVGDGSFAIVYKSEIVTHSKRKVAALKVTTDAVTRDNVTDVLAEDRIMRDLRHLNVVRYFGSSFDKSTKGLRWIMVMELCKETLKEYYTECPDRERDRRIPGANPQEHPRHRDAMSSMFRHALDIARGLEYIHEKGYTHRDMKLENILLCEKGVAKITDVGVAKPTNILVRTCKGSPAYMAPEVLLLNNNQSNKIDIYSLVLVFWEMWFGTELTIDMNKEVLGIGFMGDAMTKLKERMADPRGPWRPQLRSPNRPSNQMIDLMKRGWDVNPQVRPAASEFVAFFSEMLRNN